MLITVHFNCQKKLNGSVVRMDFCSLGQHALLEANETVTKASINVFVIFKPT